MSIPEQVGDPRRNRLAAAVFGALALSFAVTGCDGGAESPEEAAAGSRAAESSQADGTAAPAGDRTGMRFGFGTAATAEQIARWDIDIAPDGTGLPPGSATVAAGLDVYRAKCLHCHGPEGRGGQFEPLTGRVPNDEFPFATDNRYRSTVGNYWPYATTLFDYTRRAMPFDYPGSLTDEEVYASVAAMLYFNDLIPGDASVDSATVAGIEMPARDRFVADDRTGGPVIR